MSRLTRDGTAEPVSRDQILRHARGQGNIIFPVQLTTSRISNLTRLIHTLLYVMAIHQQNPVFKIVHNKSVKVYLPMCNGNVQQNPLCVESCVTKKFSMSPLFSSTIFDPDANLVLLRAHLCPAVFYAQKTPCTIFYQDENSVLLLLLIAHSCTAVLLGSIRTTLCLKSVWLFHPSVGYSLIYPTT